MTKLLFSFSALALLLWFPEIGLSSEEEPDNTFRIFDGTMYADKPNLGQYGIEYIKILYSNDFWDKGEKRRDVPAKEKIKRLADIYRDQEYVVLDIEQWPTQGHKYRPWIMDESVEKYTYVLKAFKSTAPMVKAGLFVLPVSNYSKSLAKKGSPLYDEWTKENKRFSSLAKLVDVAFVSSYTYEENWCNWKTSVEAKMQQLRSIYKGEVYLFLWPQYYDHSPAPEHLQLKFIPRDFWRFQLKTAKLMANGVVIWGGWDFKNGRSLKWDDSAEWWHETVEFIQNGQKPLKPQSCQ